MKRAVDLDNLLPRIDFKELVLAMNHGRCVLCPAPAVDAHHIMERKLFTDGGYRLRNGAAVCGPCHLACETTRVSVETVLAACGIPAPLLPPGFDPAKQYDKWGNEILGDSRRKPGPLFGDDGARRALEMGGVLWKFV